jgi:hypothetical protein
MFVFPTRADMLICIYSFLTTLSITECRLTIYVSDRKHCLSVFDMKELILFGIKKYRSGNKVETKIQHILCKICEF